MHACVSVGACARACSRACVRASERAWIDSIICVCMHVGPIRMYARMYCVMQGPESVKTIKQSA